MPELPEVETIRRGLDEKIRGLKITGAEIIFPGIIRGSSPEEFARQITGATVKKVRRRAKNLIISLSDGSSLVIHLKLTGQLIYTDPQVSLEKHTHLIFSFENGWQLRYNDLRKFGYIILARDEELPRLPQLRELGPEPLDKSFTLRRFKELLQKRLRARIKPLLMDQKFIAGIGNLYADEILFYARVHPLRLSLTLSEEEIARIYEGIKKILTAAIKRRGSSVDSYVDAAGEEGGYVPYLRVYGRETEGCFRCKTPIRRIKIGNRSAYFCPKCQMYYGFRTRKSPGQPSHLLK